MVGHVEEYSMEGNKLPISRALKNEGLFLISSYISRELKLGKDNKKCQEGKLIQKPTTWLEAW
jgi:hypothetical protein